MSEFTQFDYLLNAFARASQDAAPAKRGYAGKRQALYAYVRELEARTPPTTNGDKEEPRDEFWCHANGRTYLSKEKLLLALEHGWTVWDWDLDKAIAQLRAKAPPTAREGDALDAARYRWLREQNWFDGPLAVVRDPKQAIKLGHDAPSGARLDEAIDTALASSALTPKEQTK